MYTVVRSYFGKGAKELFDLLERNKTDVEKTMRSVKGLISYTLVRSEDGGFSVTVCNDKAGTDESLKKARDWIAKNAAGIGVAAAKGTEGSTVVDLNKGPGIRRLCLPCAEPGIWPVLWIPFGNWRDLLGAGVQPAYGGTVI